MTNNRKNYVLRTLKPIVVFILGNMTNNDPYYVKGIIENIAVSVFVIKIIS